MNTDAVMIVDDNLGSEIPRPSEHEYKEQFILFCLCCSLVVLMFCRPCSLHSHTISSAAM